MSLAVLEVKTMSWHLAPVRAAVSRDSAGEDMETSNPRMLLAGT